MTPQQVLKRIKDEGLEFVDLRFTDFPGMWQHLTVPAHEITDETFVDGRGFDGSSIRGWQAINQSDMLVIPDAATAFVDPFFQHPTLVMICDIEDPITREKYTRDPRAIARKAELYLKSTGLGDRAYIGPEAEFFVFDEVRYDTRRNGSFYEVDSVEGSWNTGRAEGPNLGYKPRPKEGYFPVPPTDTLQDLRSEMVRLMEQCGITIETAHHEVSQGGQCEIDMRFAPLVRMADQVQLYKYIVKNVARRAGKTATFMPKPLFEENGSGMHTHFSIWKGDGPLFAGDKYAGLSDMALWAIGGVLKHAPALAALTNPGTNSYKRLVPGFEAPVNLAYSSRNRSASIRIPMYSPSPKAKRIEIRFPDPSNNPYISFSAILMAALDGIKRKIDPGQPLDKDIYDMEPEELKDVPHMPFSLDDALTNLERSHDWLLHGDVFTRDVIETWIGYKRTREAQAVTIRPHPYEFFLYFDV